MYPKSKESSGGTLNSSTRLIHLKNHMVISWVNHISPFKGSGFISCSFSPLPGKMIQFDSCFLDGYFSPTTRNEFIHINLIHFLSPRIRMSTPTTEPLESRAFRGNSPTEPGPQTATTFNSKRGNFVVSCHERYLGVGKRRWMGRCVDGVTTKKWDQSCVFFLEKPGGDTSNAFFLFLPRSLGT